MIAALRRERGLAVLAAVLVAQAAILVLTRLPGREDVPESLLAGLEAGAVTRIEIEDGADGHVVMDREGDGWVLSDAGGYPADGTRIAELLDRLAAARRDRLVARTEAGRLELRVAPDGFERRVRIDAGAVGYLLYIGTTAGTGAGHVRVDGEDEVWSVDGMAPWQVVADRSDWVDPIYLRVEADRIAAFELVNAAGSFRFERSDGEWTSPVPGAGEVLDQERVTAFLDRVSTLRMRRPLGAEPPGDYRLAERAAEVRLALSPDEDGEGEGGTLELLILAGGDDDYDYVVKSSDSEYYVEVPSFTLADLVNADRSTFVTEGDTGGSPTGDSAR